MEDEKLRKVWKALESADGVVIGAGSGLSTSAGFTYEGERFRRYFSDFEEAYGIRDIYSGGFHPFPNMETFWAWWSRHIYYNRYVDPPKPVYETLHHLIDGMDYFVLTTNVDHCFQKAGFDKDRLFYTQGDYGLWQCSKPCHQKTYDNEEPVKAMLMAQGFAPDEKGIMEPPRTEEGRIDDARIHRKVPTNLVPHCPVCGEYMTMNLRSDDTFVEDDGWHSASDRYHRFLEEHASGRIVFLELGVGGNTPGIIKYPFWQMTAQNKDATYVCMNMGEIPCPKEIASRSIGIEGDIGETLSAIGVVAGREG